MPGQGTHFGVLRLLTARTGRTMTKELMVGNLLIDAMNSAAGSRRRSHFTGGAGCILPQYTELRQVSTLQAWDSGYKKSYLVDPIINMRLFEAVNVHIPEGDYKDGIRIHLLTDRIYDRLIHNVIFDFKKQEQNIVIVRKTGTEISGEEFRQKALYNAYQMLDMYVMRKSGTTAEDVEEIRELLFATMSDAHASFVSKYLNFNADLEWEDTKYLTSEIIDKLVEDQLEDIDRYFSKK